MDVPGLEQAVDVPGLEQAVDVPDAEQAFGDFDAGLEQALLAVIAPSARAAERGVSIKHALRQRSQQVCKDILGEATPPAAADDRSAGSSGPLQANAASSSAGGSGPVQATAASSSAGGLGPVQAAAASSSGERGR